MKARARAKGAEGQAETGKITIGCTGFPVPATRYFKELSFVEMPPVAVASPGMSTLRRFRREAAPSFQFAAVAPKELGQEAFRPGRVLDAALAVLDEVAVALEAGTIVFTAPSDFTAGRANKAAAKELLARVRPRFSRIVWEAPAWDPDEVAALAKDVDAVPCRDPLVQGLSKAPVAYYRLPGPAGHKSRYEDPAIDALTALAAGAAHEEVIYVFSNVDMFTDARRLQKALGRG